MQSASYRVPVAVFSSGGEMMKSAHFHINSITGQPAPLGYASGNNYVVASGFWHILLENVVDTDGDGISDEWEQRHFGNLTTATATSDTDRDGYTDLQEYLNEIASETDPEGAVYDPRIKNAPGGRGFDPSTMGTILFLALPAFIGGTQ